MALFPKFHSKHGAGFARQPVSDAERERYRGKLSDDLLALWQEDGWCGYGDGLLWTIDPESVAHIFRDDDEHTAFMRTGLGGVFYFKGNDARYLDILVGDISVALSRMSAFFDGQMCNDEYLDDVVRRDLFEQAVARLGKLHADECYGFLPPLSMGGSESLDSLKRVKLREHLAIVVQSL
jgi:hypothetical protein